MSIYSIDFIGHYPVGAVAIVQAESEEQAKDRFLETLAKEEPYLAEGNTRDKIYVTELHLDEVPCRILLNGEY